jgi:PAS domain S-box-containing protein
MRAQDKLEKMVEERTAALAEANKRLEEQVARLREVEAALKVSESQFKEAQRIAHLGNFKRDLLTNLINASDEFCRIFGVNESEPIYAYDTIFNLMHPEDRDLFLKVTQRALNDHEPFELDYRITRPDGSPRFIHVRGEVIADDAGKSVEVRGIAQDITDRKQAEDELRKQKEILQKIFNHIPVMIVFFSEDGHLQLVNREWERIRERTLPEIKQRGLDILTEFYPDPQEFQRAQDIITAGTGEWADFKTRMRDGRMMYTTWAVVHLSDGTRVSIGQDITMRKHAEESLKLFRALMDRSSDAVQVVDQTTLRFLDCNEIAYRSLGYSRGEFLSLSVRDIDPLFDQSRLAALNEEIEKSGFATFESLHRRKDGSTFPVEVSVQVVRLERDYRLAVVRDITERKRAEEAQRASRQKYESLMQSIDGIVWEVDASTFRFTFVSKQAERVLGYPLEQWISEPNFWANHLHPDDRDRAVKFCTEAVARKENHQFEYRMIAADGRVVWFRDIVSVDIMDDQSVRMRGLLVDITEREREKDERTRLLQRLVTAQEEERYRIARELHDQLGQYTAAFMMGLKSLQNSIASTLPEQNQIVKLQELTTQFSKEVRHFSLDLRPTALDDFGLHVALTNYTEEWSERNDIKLDFHSSGLVNQRFLPNIETALYRLIQEALNNVLKHARAQHVSVILENRGDHLLAILEDDGIGFDFEAAFNAAASERGLGLTGMRERIESVGGTLEFESSPGLGTTIVARIPTPSDE